MVPLRCENFERFFVFVLILFQVSITGNDMQQCSLLKSLLMNHASFFFSFFYKMKIQQTGLVFYSIFTDESAHRPKFAQDVMWLLCDLIFCKLFKSTVDLPHRIKIQSLCDTRGLIFVSVLWQTRLFHVFCFIFRDLTQNTTTWQ